ncbi:MAG: hypothetical protein ACUZ8H_13410, partial [Candidatus Anammoxibacter sp.]
MKTDSIKYWWSLRTDQRRISFLESGKAVECGLVDRTLVQDLIDVFEYRMKKQKEDETRGHFGKFFS